MKYSITVSIQHMGIAKTQYGLVAMPLWNKTHANNGRMDGWIDGWKDGSMNGLTDDVSLHAFQQYCSHIKMMGA